MARFVRAIDSMDVVTLAESFTDDGTFRFGNAEPVVGREQVQQAITGFSP